MATANIRTHTGNRLQVLFDDKIIGLAQNVRMSDDYSPEMASGIGDIHAQEYPPTVARHTVTCAFMALRSKTVLELGIMKENGDDVLKGLEIDILVVDVSPGAQPVALRKYIGCSYSTGDVDITKHAIVGQNLTFLCRDVTGIFKGNEISQENL